MINYQVNSQFFMETMGPSHTIYQHAKAVGLSGGMEQWDGVMEWQDRVEGRSDSSCKSFMNNKQPFVTLIGRAIGYCKIISCQNSEKEIF